MTLRPKITIAIAVVVLIAVAVVLFMEYWFYLPGILSRLREPIADNKPVVWEVARDRAGRSSWHSSRGSSKPNVILILADDLGMNDVSYFGGGFANGSVPTPHIDSIARDGVAFNSGYSGNATCAPSRASILTGRYATRFGFEFTPVSSRAFPQLLARASRNNSPSSGLSPAIYLEENEDAWTDPDGQALPKDEITLANVLQATGYHTAVIGKWHLGAAQWARPNERGFDESLVFLQGAALFQPTDHENVVNSMQDFDPIDKFLWANLAFAVRHNNSDRFAPDDYMTDYFADQAVEMIEANKSRPFFLYLSFNAPHTPLQATREDYEALAHIEDHTARVYGAMLRALDRGVGKVLASLHEQGLEDNTIVIFSSDNGGAHYVGLPDLNAPFRGWKASFFEGGIRVPFFMKWPGHIAPGSEFDDPVGHVDIFSTVVAAAGSEPPNDRVVDGVNLMPHLMRSNRRMPPRDLYWRSGGYRSLVSPEGWKLSLSTYPANTAWLYNLLEDPSEQNNLSESRPDVYADLEDRLSQIDSQQADPLWPSLLLAPIPLDRPLNHPPVEQEEIAYWWN